MNIQDLHKPFGPDKISWRLGSVSKTAKRGMALAYIDARDVMERLDEVCGPENWQDTYSETAKGRMICTIQIKIGGEWIGKTDGAGETDVEGEKGAISDAFKRAAVKWGIGRYLYDLKAPWVAVVEKGKSWVIADGEEAKLRGVLVGAKVPDTGSNAENRDKQARMVNEIRAQGDLDRLVDYWDKNWTRMNEFKPEWRGETFLEFIKCGIALAPTVPDLKDFLKAYEAPIKANFNADQIDSVDELADKHRSFLSQAAA
jgi:hypothetical protein